MIIDALADFFPSDLCHFVSSFFAQVVVKGIVGADRVDGIGHSVDVPIIDLDTLVEDFCAAALLTDNRRDTTLHGFKWRDTKRLGYGWHDVDVAGAEGFKNLSPFHETGEVKTIGDAAAGYKFDHAVHHVT